MTIQFEEYCPRLAESVQATTGNDWSSAKIDAVFYPDASFYYGEYTPQSGGPARSFGATFEAQEIFREMRDACRAGGQPVWGQATFLLWSNGQFSLEFSYADCDENGDKHFDEEEYLAFESERFKRLTQ